MFKSIHRVRVEPSLFAKATAMGFLGIPSACYLPLRMIRQFLFGLFTCASLLSVAIPCMCGCGADTTRAKSTILKGPDVTETRPPQATSAATVTASSNAKSAGNVELDNVNAELADSDLDSDLISGTALTQDGDLGTTTAESKPITEPKPAKQIPVPNSEQLAKWARAEFEARQLLACRESNDTGFISHLRQLSDGRHFITAGTKVVLWRVDAVEPEHVFLELSDGQTIKSLAVAPNGKWFAAGDSEGTLRMWSVADRREVNAKQLYSNDIVQIAISPDGQEISTTSYLDEITVWSAQQLQQKNRFKVDTNGLKRIEYMTNELLVAAGETTTSWNVRSGKSEKALSPGRYNFTLARSPDGSHFLFGEEDVLQLWSLPDQQAASTLNGGFASEELVAFSPNAKNLATANGSSIRLWDIASGQLVQVIDTFGAPITGLSWLPETNLLVVASLNSRVRIWGTTSDGQAVGLGPLHTTVAMPERNSREPATPAQLLQMIDLRIFPRLPGSIVSVNDEFNLLCQSEESIDEAKLFYRYQLGVAGWDEVEPAVAMPSSIKFQKDGFMITTSFYDGAPMKTSISVNFAGNYDLRWVPKFDSAPIEMAFENEDTVMVRTKAGLLDIETTLLRKIAESGWIAYSRLHAAHTEREDNRNLMFVRNSMTLNVSVGRDPADATNFIIQYGRSLTTKSMPIPQDSGFVEFDGSTKPYLVATTAMDLPKTREFYDHEMIAQGWLAREFGQSAEGDQYWLSYIRGQLDLTVTLLRLPSGKTLVRIGEGLENASWQLTKPASPVSADTAEIGIEAVDFPILNESRTAQYDPIAKSLEFSMDLTPLPEVAELYAKQLQSLDWATEGSGIRSDDYVFLTFVQNKKEIALRARITEGRAVVDIQGDGILWNKPLPGEKKLISYETWLRINHHPATLDLLDQYRDEMTSQ